MKDACNVTICPSSMFFSQISCKCVCMGYGVTNCMGNGSGSSSGFVNIGVDLHVGPNGSITLGSKKPTNYKKSE